MDRLKRHKDLLKALPLLNTKQLKSVIRHSNKDFVTCLCEVVLNVLRGKIKLKPEELKKLKRCRASLYKLAKKRTSFKKRKQILEQKGGFIFSAILPALLTTVASLITRR